MQNPGKLKNVSTGTKTAQNYSLYQFKKSRKREITCLFLGLKKTSNGTMYF